jgi:hypothetical protein
MKSFKILISIWVFILSSMSFYMVYHAMSYKIHGYLFFVILFLLTGIASIYFLIRYLIKSHKT